MPVRVEDHGYDELCASPAPPVRRIEELRPAVGPRRSRRGRWVVDVGQNINGWVRLRRTRPGRHRDHADVRRVARRGRRRHPGPRRLRPRRPRVEQTGAVPGRRGRSPPAATARSSSPATARRASSTSASRATTARSTADDVTAVVVHTDFDRRGALRLLRRPHQRAPPHRGVELPRQRLRHPDRLPDARARRLDRRLADLRRDRRVPLRRRRLLGEVAARPRRRAAARRQGDEPRPRVASRRRPPAGLLAAASKAPSGWGDAAVHVPWVVYRHDRRPPGARRPVAVDDGVGRLRRQRSRHRRATRRASTASAEPAPHERTSGTAAGTSASGSRPANRSTTAIAAAMVADHGAGRHRLPLSLRPRARRDRRASSAATTTPSGTASSPRTSPTRGDRVPRRRRHHDARHPGDLRRARSPSASIPDDLRAASADRLVELIRAAGTHLGTGFLATPFLLPVLADTGHLDVAYDLLFQDTEPSWLVMVDRGATTVWEEWGGVDADGVAARVAQPLQQGRGDHLPAPVRRRPPAASNPATAASASRRSPVADSTWADGAARQPIRAHRGPMATARRNDVGRCHGSARNHRRRRAPDREDDNRHERSPHGGGLTRGCALASSELSRRRDSSLRPRQREPASSSRAAPSATRSSRSSCSSTWCSCSGSRSARR